MVVHTLAWHGASSMEASVSEPGPTRNTTSYDVRVPNTGPGLLVPCYQVLQGRHGEHGTPKLRHVRVLTLLDRLALHHHKRHPTLDGHPMIEGPNLNRIWVWCFILEVLTASVGHSRELADEYQELSLACNHVVVP